MFRQKKYKPVEATASKISIPVSLGETIGVLKKRGYPFKFRRDEADLYCVELDSWFAADSFGIDECYYFEDRSNACRDKMLYAISSSYGLNGFLVDTCFAYAENASRKIIEKPALEYALSEDF